MALSTFLTDLLASAAQAEHQPDMLKRVRGNEGVQVAQLAALLELAEVAGGTAPFGGMQIPDHDYFSATRYGTTNNLHVITFKSGGSGGTTVATMTLTYFGGGAADDDTIQTATLAVV